MWDMRCSFCNRKLGEAASEVSRQEKEGDGQDPCEIFLKCPKCKHMNEYLFAECVLR